MRELLKAALKTASGSMGSMLLGIIAMKIMAIVLGPSGVGLYSLLRQARDVLGRVGSLGGQMAVVQGLATRKGQMRDEYLVTTFWIFVLGALVIVAVLVSLAPWIAFLVFGNDDAESIKLVRWLALPSVLGVCLAYINGVLNGFRAIGRLALLQILGSSTTAVLAYPVSRLVETGYAIAFIGLMSVSQAVALAWGVRFAMREGWFTPLLQNLYVTLHLDALRHFFSIAGATFGAGLATTGTVLAIRALIVHHNGLAGAGLFDAAWTLSVTYVMLVLTSFGTYYLPTLSQAMNLEDRLLLIRQVMRLSTILIVPLITGVVVLKPLVIRVLYSDEFTPSLEIIRWMLIGDYFKVAAWVVTMPVLAYANMWVFLWAELLWSIGYLSFAALAIFVFDSMEGVGLAFLLIYIIYFGFYLCYVWMRYRLSFTKRMMLVWSLGLTLIVLASWHMWANTQVDWGAASVWLFAAVCFSWLSAKGGVVQELNILLRRVGGKSG